MRNLEDLPTLQILIKQANFWIDKRANEKSFLAKLFGNGLNHDDQIKCTTIYRPVLNEAEM